MRRWSSAKRSSAQERTNRSHSSGEAAGARTSVFRAGRPLSGFDAWLSPWVSPTNDVDDGGTGRVFGAPPTVPPARKQAAESDAAGISAALAGPLRLLQPFIRLALTLLAMFAGSPTASRASPGT